MAESSGPAVPPTGGEINFMGMPMPNPDDAGIGPVILAVPWLFTSLAVLTVALRFYIRQKFQRHISSDDWLMLAAMACQLAGQAMFTISVGYGFGKEYLNMTVLQYIDVQKYEFLTIPFTYAVELLARLSIAILLTRIFGITRPWFKWFIIAYTGAVWIAGAVGIALSFAQYYPLEAYWDIRIKPERKMSQYVNADAALVFQCLLLIADLLLVVFPVGFVWKLTMNRGRKIGLLALLGVSLTTVAVQSYKVGLCVEGMVGKITFQEAGHIGAIFYIVTFVEQNVVIIMGSIPTLGPISQINVPVLTSLASSISGLFYKRDRSTGAGSPSRSQSDDEKGGFHHGYQAQHTFGGSARSGSGNGGMRLSDEERGTHGSKGSHGPSVVMREDRDRRKYRPDDSILRTETGEDDFVDYSHHSRA